MTPVPDNKELNNTLPTMEEIKAKIKAEKPEATEEKPEATEEKQEATAENKSDSKK